MSFRKITHAPRETCRPHHTIIIDNHDSFTYNLYQIISRLTGDDPEHETKVYRNDEISVEGLAELNPARLIISPGPGTPSDTGVSMEAINVFAGKIPILGVCLGHQCLASLYGGNIIRAGNPVHGKVELIEVDGCGVFRDLPNPSPFTRYHSLVVDPSSLPGELEITARSPDGEIMGLRHRTLPLEGVQFHPESIGSTFGERLLANFLDWRR